jgi:hypothetical protein
MMLIALVASLASLEQDGRSMTTMWISHPPGCSNQSIGLNKM